MAAGIAGDKARGKARLRLDAAARLRPNSWSSVEVSMVDLSESGFQARCEARVQPGAGISLEIPGLGTVEAQVEWQRGEQMGARFVVPIDLARCAWTLKDRSGALAELLIERAHAHLGGRNVAERQLRQQILRALPMKRITNA